MTWADSLKTFAGVAKASIKTVNVTASASVKTVGDVCMDAAGFVVTTRAVTDITDESATSGGTVPCGGSSAVTARGVCWSTSANPTTADSKTTDGSGTGAFTSSMTGLSGATMYYVRAYATNTGGTVYGNQQSFRTNGWLVGYAYRKKITITGQSGAGTDYQIKLSVGASSGGDLHLAGHASSFPADIRFTASDKTTQLSYWVKDPAADPATVWVKVSADLGSNQDIYIYYGKAGDTSASSGSDTFIFFDDFETGNFSKWSAPGSAWTIVTTQKKTGTYGAYSGWNATAANRVLKKTGISSMSRAKLITDVRFATSSGEYGAYPFYYGGQYQYPIACSSNAFKYYDTAFRVLPTATACAANTWYDIMLLFDVATNSEKIYIDGAYKGLVTNASVIIAALTNFQSLAPSTASNNNLFYIDNIGLAKYVTTEPAFSAAAAEEAR